MGLLLGLLFYKGPNLPLNGAKKYLISISVAYEVTDFMVLIRIFRGLGALVGPFDSATDLSRFH